MYAHIYIHIYVASFDRCRLRKSNSLGFRMRFKCEISTMGRPKIYGNITGVQNGQKNPVAAPSRREFATKSIDVVGFIAFYNAQKQNWMTSRL